VTVVLLTEVSTRAGLCSLICGHEQERARAIIRELHRAPVIEQTSF
jgi:hypothetical protein